jgi:hypothetical protein
VLIMRPDHWGKFSFGAWLEAAAPRLHKNKLATALANKLARIAWSVLRHGCDPDRARAQARRVSLARLLCCLSPIGVPLQSASALGRA